VVAFLRRIVLLSPADYERMAAAASAGTDDHSVKWIPDDDYGFAQLKARGNPRRGRELAGTYGCTSCHTIPYIGWGSVGPPLTAFAERQYIVGSLVNVPANVAAWIANPKRFKPNTAMPYLKVPQGDAKDIAAYLYTVGSPKRLIALERVTSRHQ